jgi:hypothetical protein
LDYFALFDKHVLLVFAVDLSRLVVDKFQKPGFVLANC